MFKKEHKDKNGNIIEQKLADIKTISKFTVLSKESASPIEGARVLFYVYSPSSKTYHLIPASSIEDGNPLFTDINGQLDLVLPQGKYRAEITDLRHKEKKVEFESYALFKSRLETEIAKLLNEEHAGHIYYVRLNKGKASILLQAKSDSSQAVFPSVFSSRRELIVFVKQKAPDLDGGKFKEIFFFLEQGYIVIRKGSRIDYVVLIGNDQEKMKQGRLLTARAATLIRKSAIERRNKRILYQQKRNAAAK